MSFKAVFISDLHLHPEEHLIQQRWEKFLDWAKCNTQSIYILGDFFHVWAGDDTMTQWHKQIIQQLVRLVESGIKIYWMPGNRDFLMGRDFCEQAKIIPLPDPFVWVTPNNTRILLAHGDAYCTYDKGHQWLRRFTRNKLFINLFLKLPLNLRTQWVNKVRTYSAQNRSKPKEYLSINTNALYKDLKQNSCTKVIHGHIHQPAKIIHNHWVQYVLSDWDHAPTIVCYTQDNQLMLFSDIL